MPHGIAHTGISLFNDLIGRKMGLRFRKSIGLAKGVRLNLGKRGIGLSVGGRGAGVSINSSGRRSARVGVPGTGLSYEVTSYRSSRRTHGGLWAVAPFVGIGIVAAILWMLFKLL